MMPDPAAELQRHVSALVAKVNESRDLAARVAWDLTDPARRHLLVEIQDLGGTAPRVHTDWVGNRLVVEVPAPVYACRLEL